MLIPTNEISHDLQVIKLNKHVEQASNSLTGCIGCNIGLWNEDMDHVEHNYHNVTITVEERQSCGR